jgi:hypothetical protein
MDTPVEPVQETAALEADDLSARPLFSSSNAVIHHASLGSGDIDLFGPGGDANYSLVANMYADGSVTGQLHDQFAGGVGLHVAVDCLLIVGNQAVVGGVVTKAPFDPNDVGTRALATVYDNGTSANDAPDELSFSFWGFFSEVDCNFFPPNLFRDLGLVFDVTRGQVHVW